MIGGGTIAGSHYQRPSSRTERIACMGAKSNPPPQPLSAASVHSMHNHIIFNKVAVA